MVLRMLCKPAFGAASEHLDNSTVHFQEKSRASRSPVPTAWRACPSAAAASLIVSPGGAMHCRSTKPPECGGFFIAMVQLPSGTIEIVNVQCRAPIG